MQLCTFDKLLTRNPRPTFGTVATMLDCLRCLTASGRSVSSNRSTLPGNSNYRSQHTQVPYLLISTYLPYCSSCSLHTDIDHGKVRSRTDRIRVPSNFFQTNRHRITFQKCLLKCRPSIKNQINEDPSIHQITRTVELSSFSPWFERTTSNRAFLVTTFPSPKVLSNVSCSEPTQNLGFLQNEACFLRIPYSFFRSSSWFVSPVVRINRVYSDAIL